MPTNTLTCWLWRTLTIGSVIFAAGPSGIWLGKMASSELPFWWGVVATILVGTLFVSGTRLAFRGERWGIAAAGVSVFILTTFNIWYFEEMSPNRLDVFTVFTIVLFPIFLAILGMKIEWRMTPKENTWQPIASKRGFMSTRLREYVVQRDGCYCQYCQRKGDMLFGPDGHKWHIDHVVPVNRGGPTHADNLTLACRTCNLRKGATPPHQMMRKED